MTKVNGQIWGNDREKCREERGKGGQIQGKNRKKWEKVERGKSNGRNIKNVGKKEVENDEFRGEMLK